MADPVHSPASTLVLGIGNLLLTDEGAGTHLLRYLMDHHHDLPDVRFLDGGTLGFTLAASIGQSERLIVLDAAELGAAPGTVRVFEGEAMDRQLGSAGISVHEVGLVDLMDMAKLSGHLPKRRALVGIQPRTIADWGDHPTEPVVAALPEAAEAVVAVVERWRGETESFSRSMNENVERDQIN